VSSAKNIPAYDPRAIEARWQAAWREQDAARTPPVSARGPLPDGARSQRVEDPSWTAEDQRWIYIKASAPFTSGNIHMGHVRSYAIGDAYARFCRARGDAVLFAFGYDAFGLPAELGAIKNDLTPTEWVRRCAEQMTAQLDRLGFSFDWARSFLSSEPNMYRWSQWLFLTFLDAGLVYRGTGTVDWCPTCNTTLATIQVEHGRCWRCHGPVLLIERPQWFLRISAYIEENDRRASELGQWDDTALGSQREVLGRVDGVELDLPAAQERGPALTVFTPYADALAAARFVLLSPRHAELSSWASDPAVLAELEEMRTGGWERAQREANVVPVLDTGRFVLAPAGAKPLPVLISPSVDSRFGPTAVLGIPERDRTDELIYARLSAGTESIAAQAAYADENVASSAPGEPYARPAVRYRARDFSVSRQRYWGTPIPIVYCDSCGVVPVPREQLPVMLPVDLRPSGSENPLAEDPAFFETECPHCHGSARRETDTLDGHFDALWLWIPACVPARAREDSLGQILALGDLRAWLPSKRLVAGSDSGNFMFDQRIATKALRDIGPLAFLANGEPFAGATMHEMVIRDGRKMSKHLGNVVEPDELIEEVGADTLRLAVLWAASPQRSLNWTESAVTRCHRFLNALWVFSQRQFAVDTGELPSSVNDTPKQSTEHLRRRLSMWCETGAAKIADALDGLEMHTGVRNVMRLFERIEDFQAQAAKKRGQLSREDHESLLEALQLLLTWLEPFAPHIAAELLAAGRERSRTPAADLQTA
jgi:leucyl-tRNA synthetase